MFKETPDGQTHSFNDGCGCPEHNCDCKKMSCQIGCTKNHTHKGFSCEICKPNEPKDNEEIIQEGLDKLYGEPIESWIEEYNRRFINNSYRENEPIEFISNLLQSERNKLKEELKERIFGLLNVTITTAKGEFTEIPAKITDEVLDIINKNV